MAQFFHPATDDITLTGVLAALGDPVRLRIVRKLHCQKDGLSCHGATPCEGLAPSTLSHHFRILRESGVVRTSKVGVSHINVLRAEDLEMRFPGVLQTILGQSPEKDAAA
ncbi:ArsR/SmtB family transcription factor [Oryzibacter oryziterrae]|uniref:ArsR/SmtB family transcription factor n=1 Tax=Oryzibacter oryziterrae TaxID=2766474 RepID=UPI001F2AC46F|nr:helix-turn-helix domain-containing protein [Oryzibacter oryziterrae]